MPRPYSTTIDGEHAEFAVTVFSDGARVRRLADRAIAWVPGRLLDMSDRAKAARDAAHVLDVLEFSRDCESRYIGPLKTKDL